MLKIFQEDEKHQDLELFPYDLTTSIEGTSSAHPSSSIDTPLYQGGSIWQTSWENPSTCPDQAECAGIEIHRQKPIFRHLETRWASLCLVYRYQKIKAWRITHWVCPKMVVPVKTRQHEICIYSYYINDLSVSVPKANKPQTLATRLGRSWDLMNRLFPFRVAHSVHLKQPRRHPSP